MNRKGFGFPSIFLVFVLTMVVVVLAAAQNGVDISSIDKAMETLNWSRYYENISNSINIAGEDSPEYVKVILSIADKAVDFMGYSVFAVTKLAVKVAEENPNIVNYKVLMALILLSLIAPLIYPLFIIIVSLILIIKEWWINRKERKNLESYQIPTKNNQKRRKP